MQDQIPPVAQPSRRLLRIYATDPLVGSDPAQRIVLSIPNESLSRGPVGSRIAVVDYDGVRERYYHPVDLNDSALLMQNGLDPSEADPRFHQQMVYAVAMKVLENFDLALGRRVSFRRNRPLKLFPHAFNGPNGFYDPKSHGVYFGYFRASRTNPGLNLPGQVVFTCLSHDIIAHEVTHALVHRLRRYFLEPSNMDVPAFHEGFADIVALFQHFSYTDILRDVITRTGGNLKEPGILVNLAEQFGQAMGAGRALRSGLGDPSKKISESITEPHERGAVLVSAVFDTFFAIYQKRISDLVRIATRGSANLPSSDLHPDLVKRVANEASKTAHSLLTICIRAFDYLPPVDVTFGDFLRALVTADYEIYPTDELGLRASLIDAFRQRGIYAQGVQSLAEESLLWPIANRSLQQKVLYTGELENLLAYDWSSSRWHSAPGALDKSDSSWDEEHDELSNQKRQNAWLKQRYKSKMYYHLHQFAKANAPLLRLDPSPSRPIHVHGFQWVFRTAPNGQLNMEFVAQFTQRSDQPASQYGGIPIRGGTTIVATPEGTIKYVIAKPLPEVRDCSREEKERQQRQLAYVNHCKMTDLRFDWRGAGYEFSHMKDRMNFFRIHQGMKS